MNWKTANTNVNVNREFVQRRVIKHLSCAVCTQWQQWNKFVFNSYLKRSLLSAGSRRLSGSELQTVRPATEKARRPRVLSRWRGTVRWRRLEVEERRCRLLVISETGVQQSTRYFGAFFMQTSVHCYSQLGLFIKAAEFVLKILKILNYTIYGHYMPKHILNTPYFFKYTTHAKFRKILTYFAATATWVKNPGETFRPRSIICGSSSGSWSRIYKF